MTNKLMYIPNDTKKSPFLKLQLVVETLGYKLNESTNQNFKNAPKVIKLTNKNMLLKDFGESVINSPMSPPSLERIIELKVYVQIVGQNFD